MVLWKPLSTFVALYPSQFMEILTEIEKVDMTNTFPSLKVDRTKLLTIQSYATLRGVHRTTIYKQIQNGSLSCVEIDGVMFIELK